MRVTRDVGPEQLTTLRAYLRTRPAARWARFWEYVSYFFLASFIGFGVLAIPFARWTAASPRWFLLSPIIGAALWHPIWLYLDRVAHKRFIAVNAAELGHQEFWIDDDGFGNSTPAGSTFHKWPTIVAVEETPRLAFVAASIHFYTIPAAGAEEELLAFVSELRRRWEAGKTVPANNKMQQTRHG